MRQATTATGPRHAAFAGFSDVVQTKYSAGGGPIPVYEKPRGLLAIDRLPARGLANGRRQFIVQYRGRSQTC
jgi:hypothetical protein